MKNRPVKRVAKDTEVAIRMILGQMKFQKAKAANEGYSEKMAEMAILRGLWVGYCCAVYFMGYEKAKVALRRVEARTCLTLPEYLPKRDVKRINEIVVGALAPVPGL